MKKFFGVFLSLVGLVLFCGGVFIGFNGKYGLNQFLNDFPHKLGSPDALLVVGMPGLAFMVFGFILFFKKKS